MIDAEETRLRTDVATAQAAYDAAGAALTPAARLELASHRARGPFDRRNPSPAEAEARRLSQAFKDADRDLRLARVALNAHRRAKAEEERQEGLRQLAERTARKDAALAARGPGNIELVHVSTAR